MQTFYIYTDAALTSVFSNYLTAVQNSDGSSPPVDFQLWLGSTASGKKLQTETSPGTGLITASVTDLAPSSGHPASDIKLATTQGGLASATGGASLTLGSTILSGVGNAATFWVRMTDSTHVAGVSTELSITFNALIELAQ
jgi:hypothetical protein